MSRPYRVLDLTEHTAAWWEWRRGGVGSLLLSHFVDTLPAPGCWCVPYANLQHFYARGGFHPAAVADAPPFLRERLAFYRQEGLDVILMRRA